VLALVGANAIWGASAVASKAVLVHVPPMTLACLRVAIALAVLLPLLARTGSRPTRGGPTALLGLTGVALFCLCQNVGLGYASAATTALINGGIPVLTALLAAVLFGERLGGRRLAGLLVSVGGVAAIVLLGPSATLSASAIGTLFPVASAVSFAAYAVLGRRIFDAGNALAIVAGSTRYGLLFLLPGAGLELATVGLGPLTLRDVLLLLYLGVGCSALAFVLCGYGLAHLEVGQGAVFGNLKPLVGVALAIALLGESLTAGHLGGGTLVLLGVVLASGRTGPVQSGAVPARTRYALGSGGAMRYGLLVLGLCTPLSGRQLLGRDLRAVGLWAEPAANRVGGASRNSRAGLRHRRPSMERGRYSL
jgi:drug/metabolite transporter (DMT)-like permease